ncbi:MAG TPA: gamma-glutamyl-phosphate reductase, partial [Acidimicrobiia bacterium]
MSRSAPVLELGRRAQAASRRLATASTGEKNDALLTAADLLVERAPEVLAANRADLDAARDAGMESGPLDRLRLTDARL